MNTSPLFERRRVSKKISLLIVIIILFLLALFEPSTRLVATLSSSVAKYRAKNVLQNIPMPSGMERIASFSIGRIDRPSCYLGEAYTFGATDLDIKDVESFYYNYFVGMGRSVSSTSEPYFYFHAVSNQKTYSGRAVDGFVIKVCDEECISELPDNSLKDIITNAQERFKSVYELRNWFIPYEVRGNMCWCCSGG